MRGAGSRQNKCAVLGARYEDGKLLKKRATFTDFVAVAEHLIAHKYTAPDRLCIEVVAPCAAACLCRMLSQTHPVLLQRPCDLPLLGTGAPLNRAAAPWCCWQGTPPGSLHTHDEAGGWAARRAARRAG